MTDPHAAHSAVTHSAASLPLERSRKLLQVIVVALLGVTLARSSFAASSASPQGHQKLSTPAHHAANRPTAHPSKTTTKSSSKQAATKHHPQRQAPPKTRVASKSKPPTRAHQTVRTPAKVATKKTKRAA